MLLALLWVFGDPEQVRRKGCSRKTASSAWRFLDRRRSVADGADLEHGRDQVRGPSRPPGFNRRVGDRRI